MNPNNTGNFGAAGGGISPELQAAITSRQTQGAPTQAVTQGSANYNPAVQPAQPPTGQAPQMTPMGQPPMPQPTAPSTPTPEKTETRYIIEALDGRLKSLSKMEQMQNDPTGGL